MLNESIRDLSQIVRAKECELREAHDARCHQLERIIAERERVLTEQVELIETLKTDFEFNLQLITSRDQEISRQDVQLQQLTEDHGVLVEERQLLLKRVVDLTEREVQRSRERNLEREQMRMRLNELRLGLEHALRKATSDNEKREAEVTRLTQELMSERARSVEAMEKQRGDMETLCESLLRARDEASQQREASLVDQLRVRDSRLEELRTGAARLAGELGLAQRRAVEAEGETAALRDQLRRNQWQNEDQRKVMLEEQEQLRTQLAAAVAQCARDVAVERAGKEKADAELRELREHLQLSAEVQSAMKIKANELEAALSAACGERNSLQQSLAEEIRSRQQTEKRVKELQYETTQFEIEINSVKIQNTHMESQLIDAQRQLQSTLREMEVLQAEVRTLSSSLGGQASALESACHDRDSLTKEVTRLRYELEGARDSVAALRSELDQLRDTEESLKTQVGRARVQVEDHLASAQQATKELEALRVEMNRLRDESDAALREAKEAKRKDGDERKQQQKQRQKRANVPEANEKDIDLDYSVPSLSFYEGLDSDYGDEDYRQISKTTSQTVQVRAGGHSGGIQGSAREDELSAENIRLRTAVSEMRANMEEVTAKLAQLQRSQNVDSATLSSTTAPASTGGVKEEVIELKSRLEQSTTEVVRLRAERRKLIDISNQLRATLTLYSGPWGPVPIDQAHPQTSIWRSARIGQSPPHTGAWGSAPIGQAPPHTGAWGSEPISLSPPQSLPHPYVNLLPQTPVQGQNPSQVHMNILPESTQQRHLQVSRDELALISTGVNSNPNMLDSNFLPNQVVASGSPLRENQLRRQHNSDGQTLRTSSSLHNLKPTPAARTARRRVMNYAKGEVM